MSSRTPPFWLVSNREQEDMDAAIGAPFSSILSLGFPKALLRFFLGRVEHGSLLRPLQVLRMGGLFYASFG